MELKVCDSGSRANGYILTNGEEALLMEAGCRYSDMLQMLDYNTAPISGMIITHPHSDHYRHIGQYRNRGFPIYEPYDTYERTAIFRLPTSDRRWDVAFRVQSFAVPHQEDLQCFGYLIKHRAAGKILFLTDLEYCPYDLSKVKPDTVMVECNYMDEYVDSEMVMFQKRRTDHKYSGHMSLQTCLDFLRTVQSENLKHVVLLHMSYETCDPDEAVRRVSDLVGENVTIDIATSGKSITI